MNSEPTGDEVLKECASCGNGWSTREEFLEDPDIILIGYQAHFEELTSGLFLFNHVCGNTLALFTEQFTDIYTGPIFKQCKVDTDECPGHCLYEDDLSPCPVECECAAVRDIIQIIAQWPKWEKQVDS